MKSFLIVLNSLDRSCSCPPLMAPTSTGLVAVTAFAVVVVSGSFSEFSATSLLSVGGAS